MLYSKHTIKCVNDMPVKVPYIVICN